jgi:hypothetical protein
VLGGKVYAGGGGGLWSSSSGDLNTWSKLSLPTSGWTADRGPLDWGYVGFMDLAVNGTTVWVAVLGKGFYRSLDGGVSWLLVKRDLFARSVALDSSTGEVYTGSSSALYAGGYSPASKGVQRSSNNGQSWQNLNQGLAYPFATYLRISATGKKWLSSPGQGILRWQ